MPFGDIELENMVAVGITTATSTRIWARSVNTGLHELEIKPAAGGAGTVVEITLDPTRDDGTGAWTLPGPVAPWVELTPDTRYEVSLSYAGERLAHASLRTAPLDRSSAPARWSFGAFSCHQPFDTDGSVSEQASSMLRAVHLAYEEADVRFILMMGDQAYADLPTGASLFDEDHFRRIAPAGRERLLDCSAAEVRALYQQRHRIFWASREFARLQSDHCCYLMLDDHEVVDNFGSDPAHAGPQWDAVRQGALDAFFDYQGSRVRERERDGSRPWSLDWGFRWGPVAVWGLDMRSHRHTVDDVTTVCTAEQFHAMQQFLDANGELPLLVVMTPIPLVHMEGRLLAMATRLLGKGSGLHERWGHPQCRGDRDHFVSILLEHSHRHPAQRLVLLGGDVHAGAAFEIDFSDGVQLLTLTSSAISNREGWLVEQACAQATHTVSRIELSDGRHGDVGLIRGRDDEHDGNPFGGLNAGIIDVYDHGDRVGVGFRLVSHDGRGNPVTVFDTGELGRRRDPATRVTGIDELPPPRR